MRLRGTISALPIWREDIDEIAVARRLRDRKIWNWRSACDAVAAHACSSALDRVERAPYHPGAEVFGLRTLRGKARRSRFLG